MSKEKNNDASFNEDELANKVHAAVKAEGWTFPENEDEIERVEQAMEEAEIELPSELMDPDVVFEKYVLRRKIYPLYGSDSNAITDYARAAREGGEITKEIEDRMQRDKEETRMKGKDGNG